MVRPLGMTSPLGVVRSSRNSALKRLPCSIFLVSSESFSLMMKRVPSGIAFGGALLFWWGLYTVDSGWDCVVFVPVLGRVLSTGLFCPFELPLSWATAPTLRASSTAQTEAIHVAFMVVTSL